MTGAVRRERVHRVTTRIVIVDSNVIIPRRYGRGETFRVTRITETLREPGGFDPPYSVTLNGPVQTKAGKDHAGRDGEERYTSRDLFQRFPAALVHELWGEQRLRDHRIAEEIAR